MFHSMERFVPRGDSSESVDRQDDGAARGHNRRSRSLACSEGREREALFRRGWVKYPDWPPRRPRKDIQKRKNKQNGRVVKRNTPCRYFTGTRCPFGKRCWFLHERKGNRSGNRSKFHRARGKRGGHTNKTSELGTKVASMAVESLLLKGKVSHVKSLVLELNSRQ